MKRTVSGTVATVLVLGIGPLVVAVFHTGEGHHAHDDHPGFKAWNAIADECQIAPAMAFGGETVLRHPD